MLSRLSIILLLVLADLPVEAATLKGVILANELSGPPMENIEIDATSGTNHTVSDSSGKFILEFPQRRAGETVRLTAKKDGYEVVNDVQLETTLSADPDAKPLIILLCKRADREEMARRFYRLKSFDTIEETYRRRLQELEDTQQATAAALTKLQQERDQAKAGADKASDELAKSRPGQSSELYQEAQRLFLAGKIDEAIKLLDDEKLRQSLAQAKKTIEDVIQTWLLKAQLLSLQFRFDEAEKAYLAAVDAVPENFLANYSYAVFSLGLNRYEQATNAFSRCLELARKSGNKAEVSDTLQSLGVLNRAQNRLEEARKDYEEALQIRRELAQKDAETKDFVAGTLINLGVLDRAQNRTEEARTDYTEALETYRELAREDPKYLLGLATTLNNLGLLDRDENRPEEAEKELEEALQIRRELAQRNRWHLPSLAATLNNLGLLDRDQDRAEKARKELEEALQIRRDLAERNPESHLPDLARTLNSLGLLDSDQDRDEEARREYEEALQIYESFAKKNPEQFSADVTRVKKLLAELPK